MPRKRNTIMCVNHRARQNLATRLSIVLRKFEREGGELDALARACDTTPRDLKRWSDGTTLPGEVLIALQGELPEHLANELSHATGRKFVPQDCGESVNALMAASGLSSLASDIAARSADGKFCHRDKAAVADEARKLIPELERLAREAGE